MTHPQQTTSAVATPRVAVIGTGTMGSAIAGRLLAAGFPVDAWDRSSPPVRALAASGATAHDDPVRAVADADVVLTLLPTAEVVTDVMLNRGVVANMKRGAIWVQMGTIGVDATGRLDDAVRRERTDIRFVDAPVSGSRQPAETGQLLVLASGPDTAEAVLAPVFSAFGRRSLWLGPAGMGSRMKLVLNTWLAFEVEAAAEAASLAHRLGISSGAMVEAIDGNPLASPLAAAKLAKIQLGDLEADFSLEWALKDLELAQASVGADHAPIAADIAKRWKSLVAAGFGGLDVSAAALGLGAEEPASA